MLVLWIVAAGRPADLRGPYVENVRPTIDLRCRRGHECDGNYWRQEMMMESARGSVHFRDLQEHGVSAFELDGNLVCFGCMTDGELEQADLKDAVLDIYMMSGEACSRCQRRLVGVPGEEFPPPDPGRLERRAKWHGRMIEKYSRAGRLGITCPECGSTDTSELEWTTAHCLTCGWQWCHRPELREWMNQPHPKTPEKDPSQLFARLFHEKLFANNAEGLKALLAVVRNKAAEGDSEALRLVEAHRELFAIS